MSATFTLTIKNSAPYAAVVTVFVSGQQSSEANLLEGQSEALQIPAGAAVIVKDLPKGALKATQPAVWPSDGEPHPMTGDVGLALKGTVNHPTIQQG